MEIRQGLMWRNPDMIKADFETLKQSMWNLGCLRSRAKARPQRRHSGARSPTQMNWVFPNHCKATTPANSEHLEGDISSATVRILIFGLSASGITKFDEFCRLWFLHRDYVGLHHLLSYIPGSPLYCYCLPSRIQRQPAYNVILDLSSRGWRGYLQLAAQKHNRLFQQWPFNAPRQMRRHQE